MTKAQRGGFSSSSDSAQLFARTAGRYDAMNRLMSLGRDRHWRRVTARALNVAPRGRVLDVGFGTGDMALALLRQRPDLEVVGIDPTHAMLRVGQRKLQGERPLIEARVTLAQADGLRLPFPDQHFDAAVSAFVLRNVVDVDQALAEQRRVVRGGGRVGCLEMSWPRSPIFGRLFGFYFATLMPRITGLLSGQPAAYGYLPRSVQRFLTPRQLNRAMARAGLSGIGCRRLGLGTVTLHVGTRAA